MSSDPPGQEDHLEWWGPQERKETLASQDQWELQDPEVPVGTWDLRVWRENQDPQDLPGPQDPPLPP